MDVSVTRNFPSLTKKSSVEEIAPFQKNKQMMSESAKLRTKMLISYQDSWIIVSKNVSFMNSVDCRIYIFCS